MTTGRPARWKVPETAAGERLDRVLAAHLELPRSRVEHWIRSGNVRIDDAIVTKTGTALTAGSTLSWNVPEAVETRIVPEAGELPILHVDDALIVIDKPPGLVVHPGAGRTRGTLAHRLLAHFPELAGVGGPGRPGIVHRLDRGTSGLLIVARTPEAHLRLSQSFADRRVDKRYLAIVWGSPRAAHGTVESAIGRHPIDRKRMAVNSRGRPARTGWRRVATAGPVSLLELALWTGRTHQIRVHARSIGHPLVGDPVYGEARHKSLRGPLAGTLGRFDRPALHAWSIAFEHPQSGAPTSFRAPIPVDLLALWTASGGADLTKLEPAASPPGGTSGTAS